MNNSPNSTQNMILQLSGGNRDGETILVDTPNCYVGTVHDSVPTPQCAIFRGPKGASIRSYSNAIRVNGFPASVHWLKNGDKIELSQEVSVEVKELGDFGISNSISNAPTNTTEFTSSTESEVAQVDASQDLAYLESRFVQIESQIVEIHNVSAETQTRFDSLDSHLSTLGNQVDRLIELMSQAEARSNPEPTPPAVESNIESSDLSTTNETVMEPVDPARTEEPNSTDSVPCTEHYYESQAGMEAPATTPAFGPSAYEGVTIGPESSVYEIPAQVPVEKVAEVPESAEAPESADSPRLRTSVPTRTPVATEVDLGRPTLTENQSSGQQEKFPEPKLENDLNVPSFGGDSEEIIVPDMTCFQSEDSTADENTRFSATPESTETIIGYGSTDSAPQTAAGDIPEMDGVSDSESDAGQIPTEEEINVRLADLERVFAGVDETESQAPVPSSSPSNFQPPQSAGSEPTEVNFEQDSAIETNGSATEYTAPASEYETPVTEYENVAPDYRATFAEEESFATDPVFQAGQSEPELRTHADETEDSFDSQSAAQQQDKSEALNDRLNQLVSQFRNSTASTGENTVPADVSPTNAYNESSANEHFPNPLEELAHSQSTDADSFADPKPAAESFLNQPLEGGSLASQLIQDCENDPIPTVSLAEEEPAGHVSETPSGDGGGESVADVLARLKSSGQWAGLPDESGGTGSPVEPIGIPDVSVSEPESVKEPESALGNQADDDGDVEDYMSQLLSRMRGGSSEVENLQAEQVSVEPEVVEEEAPETPVDPLSPEEFKPKTRAEIPKSFDKMRTLANDFSRTAVQKHEAKQRQVLGFVQLGISVASIILSIYYLFMASEKMLDLPFCIGLACIAICGLFAYRTYITLGPEHAGVSVTVRKKESAEVAQ